MRQVSKRLLAVLSLLCVGAILFACRFGQETPILFTGSAGLCPTLKALPYGEDLGLVKKVSRIEIEGITGAYCPSFIRDEKGLLLIFRHDKKERKKVLGLPTPFRQKIHIGNLKMPFRTMIGLVRLDDQFKQVQAPVRLDTGSDFSEDPRLFKMGNQTYITYNDIADNNMESRMIHIAKLDPETTTLSDRVVLDLGIRRIEKNWAPFTREEEGENKLYFGYYFNPHVILKMNDPTKNELTHVLKPNHIAVQTMPWKYSYGIVRGGTPPILVDGQYLAFFHSFFREKGKIWYVMGAYTFEANPPFRVTACSAHPIKFKGMYDTKKKNTAYSRKPSVFPAGLILDKEEGKEVLHLSLGENDCGMKVVTFDKEALLKSLVPIPEYKKKI
jgi:predicted GH43/DUF377 family glycosyl hydrolase